MGVRGSETKVKQKIRGWVKDNMLGSWHFAVPGGPFGKNGMPDDIWLWRGVFFAIEAKADEDGYVTALQRKSLREIRVAGGISAVLYGFELRKLEQIKVMILDRTPSWAGLP